MHSIKIGIIGGGPAALSLCLQLKQHFVAADIQEIIEITVFEKNGRIGSGLPYSEPDDCYILNLPKETMEPIPKETNHFANWLKLRYPHAEDTRFPPRHYFGEYLQDLAEKIQQESSHQLKFNYLTHSEVLDIQTTSAGYQVHTPSNFFLFDHVMLAIGHMPSAQYLNLIPFKKYSHYPSVEHIYDHINTQEEVGIIGTRLTAIDMALKLHSTHHRGTISMISRSGLLPTVLEKEVPLYQLKYLTMDALHNMTDFGSKKLSLETLACLFTQELQEVLGKNFKLQDIIQSYKEASPLDWITREIKEAEMGTKLWQQVLFALYPLTPQIWPLLDPVDQAIFQEKYYSLFINYLAAFPLENAYKIKELLLTGKLKVHGGLQKITFENENPVIQLETGQLLHPHFLINGTGAGYDPSQLPLLNKLIQRKMLIKHSLGGIKVDTDSMLALSELSNASLYAIGEMTKGDCLLTADLGCVTAQASKVVKHLLHKTKIDSMNLKKNKP